MTPNNTTTNNSPDTNGAQDTNTSGSYQAPEQNQAQTQHNQNQPVMQGYVAGVKPQNLKTYGVLTIVSGICNLIFTIGGFFLLVLGTIGFGLICFPLFIPTIVLGGFEIYYGMKFNDDNDHSVKNFPLAIPILQTATFMFGNIISGGIGIYGIVVSTMDEIKQYYNSVK